MQKIKVVKKHDIVFKTQNGLSTYQPRVKKVQKWKKSK